MERIAIISGAGGLPPLLAAHLKAEGRPYSVVRFGGMALDWIEDHPLIEAEFTGFGALFEALSASGVTRVCFAGGMKRPTIDPTLIDAKTAEIAPRLIASMSRGDDATLREVAKIFEEEGLIVEAAHEVMPALLAKDGAQGAFSPSRDDLGDIDRARQIVNALGAVDVGQGAVVAQGICLGLESIQGTDAMLAFVAETGGAFRRDPKGAKGVLWKAAKPGQDLRMDMPALGPDSIAAAKAAGLAGIAYAADKVMILDRSATIAAADEAQMFLFGQV